MSSGSGKKKCCERFKKGICTAKNCPFPHVIEAQVSKEKAKANTAVNAKKSKVNPIIFETTSTSTSKDSEFRSYEIENESEIRIENTLNLEQAKLQLHSFTGYVKRHIDQDSSNCKNCHRHFEITPGEREWFREKNLSLPKRCKECRLFARGEASSHHLF